ncbi:MAG: OpgC domain-containing protein [Alphaproteobacteria bacterium]|nr:OpgC domain-containing protein [Alphaproteobacteria bacterium]MBU0796136.1 OpgC domain-containing protein [Alphaproteobacteria bacterium]MBU0888507.1 OpgC domain-containing protein [Alphaproteobacteria bacterium]MBU1813030.1 OpgC domain-containing protein [Alphaproteobacteria bacterium]MBU2090732.1 OpgC domain-containing protein [Alphaproteobacteria bacterium]
MIATPASLPRQRDYRLDFFRGLALLFIFLNHIPGNAVSWITNKHFGISDATEIFVFVSGYAAAIAYSKYAFDKGMWPATKRILRRAWDIYVAHILLFLSLAVMAIWVLRCHQDIEFLAHTNILTFLVDPPMALLETLLLGYRPLNMDVLPMYVVILLAFPLGLWGLMRHPLKTMAVSAGLWLAVGAFDINLMRYPAGVWYFNPFAWQFLFMLGAFISLYPQVLYRVNQHEGKLQAAAILYLLFGLYLAATFQWPEAVPALPPFLHDLIHPIDKTNLDVLRILHFLAAAYLVSRWVSPDSSFVKSSLAAPIVVTGQHSLPIFGVGILLSFTGHWILTNLDASLQTQFVISIVGIGFMVGLAEVLSQYASYQRRQAKGGQAQPARPAKAKTAIIARESYNTR